MIIKNQDSLCPVCGQKGRSVQIFTIRSLLKEQLSSAILNEDYSFCLNPECNTVYFSATKDSIFQKHDLKIRVGLKEKTQPRTLCYCFGITIEDVHAEIREKGKSTIESDISEKVEAGLCHCEDANPEGRCCLGRVSAAVKEAYRMQGDNDEAGISIKKDSDCCKCTA